MRAVGHATLGGAGLAISHVAVAAPPRTRGLFTLYSSQRLERGGPTRPRPARAV